MYFFTVYVLGGMYESRFLVPVIAWKMRMLTRDNAIFRILEGSGTGTRVFIKTHHIAHFFNQQTGKSAYPSKEHDRLYAVRFSDPKMTGRRHVITKSALLQYSAHAAGNRRVDEATAVIAIPNPGE